MYLKPNTLQDNTEHKYYSESKRNKLKVGTVQKPKGYCHCKKIFKCKLKQGTKIPLKPISIN